MVVLIRGSFWRASYDLTLMEDLAADGAARGWAAWNIEYRRVGQDGGGWPGTFADAAAALDHLSTISDHPATPLDLGRVAVVGHSAGGRMPTGVPTRCMHGTADDIVPIDQSERYVAAATRAGDDAVLAPFDGDHFAVLDPTHESWADTVTWLRPFLNP